MTPSTPSNPNEALILGAVRTPFGRRGGALRETRPDELLATAIGGVLARTGLPAEKVGDVLAGCVSQAGEQGANIARQALLIAGLPAEVPGVSMNRMCGSSQFATHAASQAVAAGDLDFAIGCGVESMSRVPMFLDLTLGQGDFRGFDNLHPKILERFAIPHQVESAERIADQWQISRAEMDDYAIESHRRAEAARAAGLHAEILPVAGVDKEGGPITLAHDEGIRAVIDVERMRAQPQQVVQEARDLVEHDADVLRAQRHFQAKQLLDRQHVTVLVAHHRHIVETVHVRHRLQISLLLGQLFGGAMQQADVRIGALDHFAVEFEHQAQHAVRGRMLRTKVESVILDVSHYLTPYCSSRITRGVISRGSIVTGW